MSDLREVIDENHRMMVQKGFYAEAQKQRLPRDTASLIALSWRLKRLSVVLNQQRKGKFHESAEMNATYIPDGMTAKNVHILRQILHIVDEIGEFLHEWEESNYTNIDYEEFADIFIVYADIAGFLGTETVVRAIEKKMVKNSKRGMTYGRAEDLGFVDLSSQPGVIEELVGKNAPTFDELAKAFEEQPLMAEGEFPMEQNYDSTQNTTEEDSTHEKETDQFDKAEQNQEQTLKKVYGNSFAQSLQGGQTVPLDNTDQERNTGEELKK